MKIVISLISLVILSMLIYFNTSRGSLEIKGKPPINFYKDGELMWLIDTTNQDYFNLHTLAEYKANRWWEHVEHSYETYLNKVNNINQNRVVPNHVNNINRANTTNPYKYDNWRLPTKDELMRLEDKTGILGRFFTLKSTKNIIRTGAIDENIFYDLKKGYVFYLTSTIGGVDENGDPLGYFITFSFHKYPCHFWECLNPRNGGATCCDKNGIQVEKSYRYKNSSLRLVRTRTQEEMKDDYKVMGWRYIRDALEWLKK